MNYEKVLEHYLDGIDKNVSLVDDAIMTLEQYFSYIDGEELLHHSRPLAMAYLALKEIANKDKSDSKKSGDWITDSDGIFVCTECGEPAPQRMMFHLKQFYWTCDVQCTPFCPHCGCQMIVTRVRRKEDG